MTEQKIITDEFAATYKNKHPNWGFNGLGYIVYKRTYSRIKDNGENEEWYETIQRCINGAQKIGAQYTKEEAEKLFDYVFNLKCNFAGRMLWQLGTSTVDRFGSNSLLNCWFTSMNEPKAFLFLFENLMLGGGVGYSIRREDVMELPKIKKEVKITHKASKDADFIVPDSREGWVKLLENILNSFFVNGKSMTYSTILIRGAGERINGFGGSASGPKILVEGIEKITTIFQNREGKKLRSLDVLDICNIIGSIVVAGNVRRSAEVALGDPDDILYMRAKNWNTGNIPNWRSMSNNTLYVDDYSHLMDEFWSNGYEVNPETGTANGEPYGLFNLPLSQKHGRLIDPPMKDCSMYPTDSDNVVGTNPCGEISLANYEACNLSELYLNNISSKDELISCAKLLYKAQKAIAALQFIHEETNKVAHKNMRLGMGVTGICQSLDKIEWLDDCYVALRKHDKQWSKQRGWPESIKLSTIKPSGCQVGDTLLITDSGILRLDEIGDIKGDTWQNHSIEICQENTQSTSTKFYNSGLSKTKKFTLSSGIELECSLEHQYRVLKDGNYVWKKSTEIEIGDIIPYRLGGYTNPMDCDLPILEWPTSSITGKTLNFKKFTQPERITPDIAWVLGLYFADGSNHEKGIRIAGNINGIAVLEKAQRILMETFKLESIIYPRTKCENNADLYVNNTGFIWWLKKQKLDKGFCEVIEVPPILRRSSRSSVLSFIDGFKNGDGCFKTNGDSFVTVSKKFAVEMVIIMRAVGIDAKLREMPPTDSSYGKLMRYWVSERNSRFNKSKWRYIKSETVNIWETLDLLDLCHLSYDTVESIEEGESFVYDIEVPENNTYIANSVVSHNTLSLLGGATPGVHPSYSKFYNRTVRMSSGDKLVQICKDLGYHVEFLLHLDGTVNRDTNVVYFPCKTPDGALLAKDVGVIKQLEMVKKLQSVWSDNAVSVTAYYEPKELPELKKWLKDNYKFNIKSISFLLRQEHGFKQAPYQEITEEEYNSAISRIKPMTESAVSGDMLQGLECEGGVCPLR